MIPKDVRSLAWLMTLGLTAGCSQELTGPSPSLPPPGGEVAVTTPSFACNEQLDQWIVVRGERLSPLVIDTIDGELDPSVVLPKLALTRVASIEGESAPAGEPVAVEATAEAASPLKWISASELRLLVSPGLALEPGIYDLTATNANGNKATSAQALGVLPRPTVTAVVPELACVKQGERAVVVEGDHFLIKGAELPAVQIGPNTYAPTKAEDCRALGAIFGEHQVCKKLSVTIPAADLEAARHLITVTNLEPAACASLPDEDKVGLTVVPPPSVADVAPQPICGEQLDYEMMKVTGAGFIKVGAAVPTITVGDKTYTAAALDGCAAIPDLASLQAERCTGLTFAIAAGDLAGAVAQGARSGAPAINVKNPDPAGCTSEESKTLTVVPPPTVDDLAPNPVCLAGSAREVTVNGFGFLDVDGALPQVQLGDQTYAPTRADGCEAIASAPGAVRSCTALVVEVPQGALDAGAHAAKVTNPAPAACASTQAVELIDVPPPTLAGVSVAYTCAAGRDATFSLSGDGFITLAGALPTVTVGGQAATVTAATGCQTDPSGLGFDRCTGLDITLAADALAPGEHAIEVTNPGSTDCASAPGVSLRLVAPATVTSVSPSPTCNDTSDTTFTIQGSDFLKVGAVLPEVTISGQTYAATSAAGCAPVADAAGTESCTSLTFTATQNTLTPGPQAVEVTNPAPAACVSTSGVEVLIAGPPVITQAMPSLVCDNGSFDGQLTLTGTNFLRINGQAGTITANGTPLTGTLSSCTTIPDANNTIEACTSMSVTVPAALRVQSVTFALTNPAPADCGSSQLVLPLEVAPKIVTVTPLRICTTGGTLQLDGQDFLQGMTVELGGVSAASVTVNPAGTQAVATFTTTPSAGLSTLRAVNPNTCDKTFGDPVRVTSGPVVVYVDPPVTYTPIATQVTLYVASLYGGTVTEVKARDSAGTETVLSTSFDPAQPNTVQAVIPADLLAQGVSTDTLDFIVTDDIQCSGTGDDLVTSTDVLTVAVDEISPPFGWKSADTGVIVTSPATPPVGQSQYIATPRVYLNPSNAQPGDLATELSSTTFNGATELGGIVPSGLPVGQYDIIVVNPDGTVGVKTGAFTVTEDPPPLIDAISPGSWQTNNAALPVQLDGQNFNDPTVSVTCRDPGGALDIPPVTRTSFTATRAEVTVNTTNLDGLSTCVVRLTNADNSYVDYSPVTITNPAGNFVNFKPGANLNVARRGLALVGAAPSRASTFLYAIGGADATAAGVMTTGEMSAIDRFGDLVGWTALPYELPEGRAFAEAVRVEDFIYLVGGTNGVKSQDTVWRAQVLDPRFTPDVTNVEFDIDLEAGGGMPTGVYIYRVSAVMAAGDAANPSGETLASDPQAVRVPVAGVALTLKWSAIAGAAEYRVYRSPVADSPFGTEELLATIPSSATSFLDDGAGTTSAGVKPLPLGALGKWHSVASLTQPRERHGVVVAADPLDATQRHLYALAGRQDDSNNPGSFVTLSSYDRLTITVNGPRDQTMAATATAGVTPLPLARHSAAALLGDASNASYLSGAYVYVLGGITQGGSMDRGVDVAQVLPGGLLGPWQDLGNMQRSRAGYAAAIANNNIVTAGGQNATPSNSADKGRLCSPADGCAAPDIDQWSSLSNVNMRDRLYMGDASFGGFLYMAGGLDGANAPTNTVDQSPLGGTP